MKSKYDPKKLTELRARGLTLAEIATYFVGGHKEGVKAALERIEIKRVRATAKKRI